MYIPKLIEIRALLGPTLLTASGAASNSLRSLAAAAGLDDDAPPPREAWP